METKQYALDVISEKIIAGPHVRAACRRFINDLRRDDIYFDEEREQHAFAFFREVLKLNGGDFEGVPYELLLWQKFVIGNLFGWYVSEGKRRFRKCFIETSKGSGKSPLAAGVALYGLVADSENRAEIYVGAAKRDQAMIMFRDAVAMVDQSPELAERIKKSGTGEQVWNMSYQKTASFFRPLAADMSQSGTRPHFAILDEIHEHRNANLLEMLAAGTKGRKNPLIFMITNSGHDKNSVAYHYHEYSIKVSNGVLIDDAFFGYVCALDENEDPFNDKSCWIKTNPSLGVTIQEQYLEEQVNQAKGMPSKESIVRRLNFSEWVGAANPWLSQELWLSALDDDIDLTGRECFGGLDLSSTQDLTSFVLAFPPTDTDKYMRILPFFWLPDGDIVNKANKDGVDYLTWVKRGYLELTPGSAISKSFVISRIQEITKQYNLRITAYDKWHINDFKQQLLEMNIEMELENFQQSYAGMAPAVNTIETLLLNQEIKHNGNPCLTWNASNAVLETDAAGNRKPTKDPKKMTGRIDGIIAMLMAVQTSKNYNEGPKIEDFIFNPIIV